MPTLTLPTTVCEKVLPYQVWDGQLLRSSRECPLGFDTETSVIRDPRRVTQLALAVASDGRTHIVVHADRLGEFLLAHRSAFFVGHNFAFDFWVLNQFFAERGEEDSRRVLWDAVDQGRVFDTQILDMLLQLGTGKFRKVTGSGKDGDTKVYPGNLGEVAADYTSLRITKDDPYRLRFGELIGLSLDQWCGVDPGFFEYAVRDAITTRRLYPALAESAYRLMTAFGFDRNAQRYDIRPDALNKYGYLSEVLQVKASIVLADMFRRGVRVDVARTKALEENFRSEMDDLVGVLRRDYADVLSFKKDGTLRLTPLGQIPSLGQAELGARLQQVANEIQAQGHPIQVPISKSNEQKTLSLSAKSWSRFAGLHPFLGVWSRVKKLGKLLEFVASLRAERLHAEYTLLTRTGRTSCSKPRDAAVPGLNVQQMPKLPEFRELFVPDPNHRLFVGDFAAAELRTLAAVCRAKFGASKLGDVIGKGTDPHAFTAAAIQGLTPEEFADLKSADPKRYKDGRQQSKPINFGVPGGMGAQSLMEYARANYGVTLTIEDAQRFRQELIEKIYPELNDRDGYLADPSMAALARNLGVTEREAWEVFDRSGQRSRIAALGVAKVIRGRSTASEYYQATVWAGLCRLLRTVREPDPESVELIAREQGGQRLHDLLYRQSIATLTGRLRAGVGYCEAKNTPFQSLCADGAKLALWKLVYAGFDVYAFIHDEILVQLPVSSGEADARKVKAIMEDAMAEVMGHGIPAECDCHVVDCWKKP